MKDISTKLMIKKEIEKYINRNNELKIIITQSKLNKSKIDENTENNEINENITIKDDINNDNDVNNNEEITDLSVQGNNTFNKIKNKK